MFILTGSHQAALHSAVSQSSAGRTALLKLLPLGLEELRQAGIQTPQEEIIFRGGYPRIYKEDLSPLDAYGSYFQTYVERDVRQILGIKNLLQFERFMKLTAGRVGQIVNYASLASDVGISAVTVKEWISVLEATYILIRLEPYFENFGKRLIKSPKLYFTDTGFLCHLLGIEGTDSLIRDSLYGNIFENWVVTELMKSRSHRGLEPRLYFYRDVEGREVDLLFQQGSRLIPLEIKSGKTFSPAWLKSLQAFHEQAHKKAEGGFLIYGGDQTQQVGAFRVCSVEECCRVLPS